MTDQEIRDIAVELLCDLAPDIDPWEVGPRTNPREELELDSTGFLNFAIALHQRFDIDIPEADYPRLVTIGGCVDYLRARMADARGRP